LVNKFHKIRNVADKLPNHLAATVTKQMRTVYHAESTLARQAQLEALARELDRTHPGAAASLREGITETLTVLRLGVPPTLARTLCSTNSIESMISIARTHCRNVKHWRNGQMGCAGVPQGWPKPASNSAVSTATCTCPHYVKPSNATPPRKCQCHQSK
jgi:hypothetical protein